MSANTSSDASSDDSGGSQDDPFTRWIADVGPMQCAPADLPDIEISKPTVAAIAVILTGAAVIAVALAWVTFAFAISLGIVDIGALALLAVGTVLVIAGGGFTYVAHRRQ